MTTHVGGFCPIVRIAPDSHEPMGGQNLGGRFENLDERVDGVFKTTEAGLADDLEALARRLDAAEKTSSCLEKRIDEVNRNISTAATIGSRALCTMAGVVVLTHSGDFVTAAHCFGICAPGVTL